MLHRVGGEGQSAVSGAFLCRLVGAVLCVVLCVVLWVVCVCVCDDIWETSKHDKRKGKNDRENYMCETSDDPGIERQKSYVRNIKTHRN